MRCSAITAVTSGSPSSTNAQRGYSPYNAFRLLQQTINNARPLPYPLQRHAIRSLQKTEGIDRSAITSMWAGQSVRLLKHRDADELLQGLVAETVAYFANINL